MNWNCLGNCRKNKRLQENVGKERQAEESGPSCEHGSWQHVDTCEEGPMVQDQGPAWAHMHPGGAPLLEPGLDL